MGRTDAWLDRRDCRAARERQGLCSGRPTLGGGTHLCLVGQVAAPQQRLRANDQKQRNLHLHRYDRPYAQAIGKGIALPIQSLTTYWYGPTALPSSSIGPTCAWATA